MALINAERLRERLSHRGQPRGVQPAGKPAESADAESERAADRRRLAGIDAVAERWRDVPVREHRVNRHLAEQVERARIRSGAALEIGGREHPRGHVLGDGFSYVNLDIEAGEDPATIVGDITDCPQIPDASYDVVLSVDVFEHIDRPWLAANEITRILKPGGLVYTSTLFSWRYHPCPIDFWRFTPEALAFLFGDLIVLDNGFDLTERRRDIRKKATTDPMRIDALGGWRENVRVYHAGVKRP